MFRNRRTSQKPSDELYRNFKADFPQLSTTAAPPPSASSSAAPPQHSQPDAQTLPTTSLAEALDVPINPRSLDDSSQPHDSNSSNIKDADPTPRGSNEPWHFGTSGLTPSLMDPNATNFNMFAHHLSGYYTPPPGGGGSTLYHSQAGDLHTPQGFGGMGLGTPLSMPTSESGLHAGQQVAPYHGFHSHMQQHLPPQQFQNVNPFHMHHQPQAYPPQQFTHQPTFETMDGQVGDSPVDDLGMDLGPMPQQHHSPEMLFQPPNLQRTMQPPPLHPQGEKFRYHVTLNAPTAMIKHSDEIPVTYLNKGQAYTLNVVDTKMQQGSPSGRYRTFVRVSFEDEQQRLKPASCWQLWKEGRGTNEAHHRGGRLQAVEYVDSGQSGIAEDPSKPKVELESASFDGFCVLWSPPNGTAECPISVRFNFLSTDFSHSKGVKGIPVRLCAKTESLEEASIAPTQATGSEVCYCKVKLFRDHGAERKLSNDVAHVKKTIDKLNQQIAQLESGMRDLGKRKRSGSIAKGLERPVKVPKHRRTWSMTSVGSSGGKGSAEEDLHIKLMALQDMFTSTRPASVLYLRGEDGDDPDAHPVKLTGELAEFVRNDSGESAWEKQSVNGMNSSMQSPTPSSANSLVGSRKDSSMQQPTPVGGLSRDNSNEWRNNPQTATMDIQPTIPEQLQSPPDNTTLTKVKTRSPKSGAVSGWIDALGVDPGYRPPPERPVKPVACFYVQGRVAGKSPADSYYRAVYITKRTLKDFNNAVAMKCGVEPTEVLRTFRITEDGINILFDDECIRELPEGQDMTAEFSEIDPDDGPVKPKREWDAASTDVPCDGDVPTIENVCSTGFELKLLF